MINAEVRGLAARVLASLRNRRSIPVLTGPTASGKTGLVLDLFENYSDDGVLEVLSADAYQVYRGMDIGTDKPSTALRRRVPHHLVDILDPADRYTAGRFVRDAETAIRAILEKGSRPLVCGGSGMYLWALVEGLHEAPPADEELRGRNPTREELLALVRGLDPAAEAALAAEPRHRLIRAVEILRGTGQSLAEWRATPRRKPAFEYEVFALLPERDALYARIDARVDEMMVRGFVEEVRGLKERGITPELPSQKAIGYRELHRHLAGEIDLPAAVALIKRNSRRYAKRQLTWLRGHGAARPG